MTPSFSLIEYNTYFLFGVTTLLYHLNIRLSVEDNKKRGCSVENQKLVLNDFLADKPDFVVYDTYIDNGATGTNFHRPGFQQMLSDIETGHIDCVIVKDLSRLGRNSIDTGYYIEQYFHTHNVRFIAVTDQFDTADPGSLHSGIMLPLKNMINEAYALDIGRKIKAQARQAMKDGDYIGARAPYGYRKDPDNCHKLLIDEDTAPVVRQIFEWAHEHVALNRIVRNLNEMGITAPSHYKKSTGEITSPGLIGSGKWQTRTVMKILESEVYTGDLVQGKTKIVDHQQVKAGEDNLIIARRTHEPIISYELFTAVQEYRKQICEESRAVPKRPYTPNIFKGKVFCADCGRSLHRQRAERKKGPDVYWFHCLTNSRVAKDSCKGVMMQETELISTVTVILEKELSVALGMSLPLFQLEAKQKQDKDRLKTRMSARRQEIEKKRRLIRSLYENFVQSILTNEEYFELKADYEESIRTLSGEIETLEKDMDALDNRLVRCRSMEKDAKSLAQDHALTAELIDRLIERIEIDHERNIHVTFRFKNEFQGKAVEPCTKNM
ncbi:recombinase family protein [Lachnospiraceae bacterium 48-33]